MFFDKLFGTDKPANPQTDNVRLLTTTYKPEELAVYESILRNAGIRYLLRARGAGDSVKIITGFTAFGTDIYVDNEQFEEATVLIAPNDETVVESDTENNDGGKDD